MTTREPTEAVEPAALSSVTVTRTRWGALRQKYLNPRYAIMSLVVGFVAFFALTPLLFLVYRTLTDSDGAFTLSNLAAAYGDADALGMMWNSAVFAVFSSALAMIIGTSLAYLHVRTDISFKPLLFAISLVPLIIPGLVYTIAWILLASPRTGILNLLLEPVVGGRPLDIFGMTGMVWVEATNLSPLVFLLMLASFRSMDPSLEESALVSGASGWTVMRRVTFPLVKPAFLAATLIMLVRSIESFEVPALLGMPRNVWVFTSRIWNEMSTYPSDIGAAGAYATVLLIIAAVGVVLHNWYAKRGGEKSVQTVGGKAFRTRPRALRGRARVAANAFIGFYALTVIVLPGLALLYSSFLPFNMPVSSEAFDAMSLDNYRQLLHSEVVRRGFKNSFILSITSATIVMFVMSIAAWMVVRTKARGRTLLDNLSFSPMVFPGIVLGLSLLIVYLRLPWIPIYGTLAILLVAYMTKYMPYGMRYAATSMYQIHNELEESAHVFGATWWQTFRRIILPLLVPGFLAGWVYIAMISVRELSSSLLIYSPGNEVLAVSMWHLYEEAEVTTLAALSIVLMFFLIILVGIAYKVGSKVGIRQDTPAV